MVTADGQAKATHAWRHGRLQRAAGRTSGLSACRESPARIASTGRSARHDRPDHTGFSDAQLAVRCTR